MNLSSSLFPALKVAAGHQDSPCTLVLICWATARPEAPPSQQTPPPLSGPGMSSATGLKVTVPAGHPTHDDESPEKQTRVPSCPHFLFLHVQFFLPCCSHSWPALTSAQCQVQHPCRDFFTTSRNCVRSNPCQNSHILYHSEWFCFCDQTLTDTLFFGF